MNKNISTKSKFYRLLEIVPGLISWNIIFFIFWGSFLIPKLLAYFVTAFLIYWLYQSIKSSVLGVIGFKKIKTSEKTNWFAKYKREQKKNWLSWEKIKHVIIIPIVNEPIEIVNKNVDRLAKQKNIDPKKHLIVVLAMEKRVEGSKAKAKKIISKYKNSFYTIISTHHPTNLKGEIIGKASNETWAAKKVEEKLIKTGKLSVKYLTLTSCDSDTIFHSKLFSALSYYFSKDPNRYLKFWQSPIFYYNNMHRVPAPIRIVAIMGGIIHLSTLQEPEQLAFNMSSYSASFKLIKDAGYWDTDIISEDWHVFLQTFFANQAKVKVKPIFLPTNMDAPEGKTYLKALKNRYLQCQRHAWGATDFPYAIKKAVEHKEIPFLPKFLRIYQLLKSHLIWSTNWFILTLGASIPPLLNPNFFQTSLGYNLPKLAKTILNICLSGILVISILDLKLQSKKVDFFYGIKYFLTWILIPVSSLLMSTLPGLHSQTKLMFGKRLEYYVTEKHSD